MKAFNIGMAVLAAVAAMTMAGPVFAGQTQAEREKVLRQRADAESAPGWQIAPAKETPRERPETIEGEGRGGDGSCRCGDRRK